MSTRGDVADAAYDAWRSGHDYDTAYDRASDAYYGGASPEEIHAAALYRRSGPEPDLSPERDYDAEYEAWVSRAYEEYVRECLSTPEPAHD